MFWKILPLNTETRMVFAQSQEFPFLFRWGSPVSFSSLVSSPCCEVTPDCWARNLPGWSQAQGWWQWCPLCSSYVLDYSQSREKRLTSCQPWAGPSTTPCSQDPGLATAYFPRNTCFPMWRSRRHCNCNDFYFLAKTCVNHTVCTQQNALILPCENTETDHAGGSQAPVCISGHLTFWMLISDTECEFTASSSIFPFVMSPKSIWVLRHIESADIHEGRVGIRC